jgi:rRNA maturation endonuclease Nob1
MTRDKRPLRVIHCHGCDAGVLVQFADACPRCGEPNSPLQSVHNDECHACGRPVKNYTPSALAHTKERGAA